MMPDRPLLKKSAFWRTLPLVMFIPLLLVLGVGVGLYLNGTPLNELILPIGAMTIFALAIGLFFAVVALITTVSERASIGRIFREPWASFAQFPNDAVWRSYAEAERQQGIKATGVPWASLIVVIVVFGFVVGFLVVKLNPPPALYFGVGAMLLIILAIVFGGAIKGRMAVNAEYRRRVGMPPPTTTVGKSGLYDDDKGYSSLGGLRDVRYVEANESPDAYIDRFTLRAGSIEPLGNGWGTLLFTVRWYRRFIAHTSVIGVRVPPNQAAQARALVDRFQRERL